MALLAAIHFRAGRMGLEPSPEHDRGAVLGKLHLLLPLLIIVILLAQGRSPMRAAFWGVVSTLAMSLIRADTRMGTARLADGLVKAASGAVQVAAACAAAGIVVGVASLTGIGLRMSELIVLLSGGNLLAALGLTAVGSIVLGMGLPTTAAYVVLAALGAPALIGLGVPALAAHFFIFYFGCLSNVTPPVALASYAAAGISGAPAFRTALYGAVLALPGFLVPFLFVYHPALLLEGAGLEIARAAVTGGMGVVALAAGTMGFLSRPLATWERLLLAAVAFALITPSIWTDTAGFVLLVGMLMRVRSTRTPEGVGAPAS
jgi:TRAP transporter 4TM/12TM fusion protein